jgi:hypothetical protein
MIEVRQPLLCEWSFLGDLLRARLCAGVLARGHLAHSNWHRTTLGSQLSVWKPVVGVGHSLLHCTAVVVARA